MKKKKRKTYLTNYHPEDQVFEPKTCYICLKEITSIQRFYSIGKDKNGIELYRHCKCKPRSIK